MIMAEAARRHDVREASRQCLEMNRFDGAGNHLARAAPVIRVSEDAPPRHQDQGDTQQDQSPVGARRTDFETFNDQQGVNSVPGVRLELPLAPG
jgi:hypothetical protein